ncbi:MAG: TolC family protein [Candidatus Margulisiibacteriota bacterium]|jgi:outer membrane protein TolC
MRKTIGSSFVLVLVLVLAAQGLTLKESLDLANRNNPTVIAAQKKQAAAGAKLGQATGAFLPTIKLDANYSKSYTQPSLIQFTVPTSTGSVTQSFTSGTDSTVTSNSWTASLNQPLFVAALWPGLSLARKGVELADEELKKVQLESAFNVTQSYFGVLKAEKFVKLSQESKEMAQSHLNQVKAMFSAGVATRADLLRGEVQLANTDVSLTKAKNGLELAKDAFNNALGRDLEQTVALEDGSLSGAIAALPEYQDLFKLALANRPEWRQFQLNKKIVEETLRISQVEYYPTIFLVGQIGNRGMEYPGYNSSVNSWSVAGVGSWALFDGFGRENRIKENGANLEVQTANEDQFRSGLALEVRDIYLTIKSALEIINSAEKAVTSAAESYKVSASRYNSGVGTNIEVLDAQVALTQAKINHLQSLFDLEIAKAKLNKIVGREVVL